MIHNDKQLGKPYIMFKLTKAQIEAIPGLEVGSFAMAEDVNEIGFLTATGWEWVVTGSGASGGTPDAHASTHEFGGTDVIDLTNLTGVLGQPQVPINHALMHEHDGLDEISVQDLHGRLLDDQDADSILGKTVPAVPATSSLLGTLGSAQSTMNWFASTDFAVAAKGVTNGDSHDHSGGDGADIKGTYVPITPVDLTDSAANTWAPFAAPTGTYTFRPEDNSNAWPTTASALHVLVLGRWATASNSSILSLRQSSGGTNHIQLRAVSATVGLNVNGNISLDGSGYFYAVVEGANMAVAVVRVLGYYR